MLDPLKGRIDCPKFLSLVERSLKTPIHEESGKIIHPRLGVPQGNVLGPLLANIVLHKMDEYVLGLKSNFDKGTKRRNNPLWKKLVRKDRASPQDLKQAYKLDSVDRMDPNFKRLVYVRYADDFVVGLASSFEEATEIKSLIADFLDRELELKLNSEKTSISHLIKDGFHFLETDIYRKKVDPRAGKPIKLNSAGKRVRITSELQFGAPIQKLINKLTELKFVKRKNGLTYGTKVNRLLALDHSDIVGFYNQKIRGIIEYYTHATNRSKLHSIVWLLTESCARTLGGKFRLPTMRKVFRKFGRGLTAVLDANKSISILQPSLRNVKG